MIIDATIRPLSEGLGHLLVDPQTGTYRLTIDSAVKLSDQQIQELGQDFVKRLGASVVEIRQQPETLVSCWVRDNDRIEVSIDEHSFDLSLVDAGSLAQLLTHCVRIVEGEQAARESAQPTAPFPDKITIAPGDTVVITAKGVEHHRPSPSDAGSALDNGVPESSFVREEPGVSKVWAETGVVHADKTTCLTLR